jgi:hypothetical protein
MESEMPGMRGYPQLAANADCLYQYIGRYKYAVVTDPDELIVPYQSRNMTDMLQALEDMPFLTNLEEQGAVRKKGSFALLNAFFPLELEDDKDLPFCQGESCYHYPTSSRKTKMIIRLTHVPNR